MIKVLRCADLTGDCEFEAIGETLDGVVQEAAAHVKNDHAMNVSAELVERLRSVVRDG